MNGSTEQPSVAIRRTWGFKFYLASLFFLGYMVLNWLQVHPIEYMGPFGRNIFPAISAAGLTVKQGIAEFSGRPIPQAEEWTGAGIVLALCCYFVLLPVSYLSLRDRSRRRKEEGRPWSPVHSGLLAVVSFFGLLIPCVMAGTFYASATIHQPLKRSHTLALYENASYQLADEVAFRLREFAARSAAAGGGGGTFLLKDGPVTLADIGVQEQNRSGRFILVPQRSDTTVQLLFIGTKPFPSTTWDLEATTGTLILETTIYPSSHRIVPIR